jgi:hypothetical protein
MENLVKGNIEPSTKYNSYRTFISKFAHNEKILAKEK